MRCYIVATPSHLIHANYAVGEIAHEKRTATGYDGDTAKETMLVDLREEDRRRALSFDVCSAASLTVLRETGRLIVQFRQFRLIVSDQVTVYRVIRGARARDRASTSAVESPWTASYAARRFRLRSIPRRVNSDWADI